MIENLSIDNIVVCCSYCCAIKRGKGNDSWDYSAGAKREYKELMSERKSNENLSHGICPPCYKIQLEKLEIMDKQKGLNLTGLENVSYRNDCKNV